MSEVKDISSIEGGAFPSLEVMQRYLRGEASDDEKAQIEAMLQDDPMMADAIEGLEMIKDPAVLQRSIQKINLHSRQQLKRQINKREALIRRQSRITPKKLLPYIGTAAAAIALLITTVFVIQQMGPSADLVRSSEQAAKPTMSEARPQSETRLEAESDNSLGSNILPAEEKEESDAGRSAQRQQPIAQATPPVKRRREDNANPASSGESASLPIENQATSPAPGRVAADDFEIVAPQPKTNNNTSPVPLAPVSSGQAEPAIEHDASIALSDDIVDENQDSAGAEYFDEEELASIPVYENEERASNTLPYSGKPKRQNKKAKQTASAEPLADSAPRRSLQDIQQGQLERTAAISDMIAKAARHLEAKEYDEAILQLDEVLLTEPLNVVAHHYRAAAYLAKGNDEAALFSLETVVRIGSGENFEADQWALAQLYHRLGKKLKARSLLKAIVKAGGLYAAEAKALLEE